MNKNKILLVGSGAMAQEYAKVLHGQDRDFMVIGRGKESAKIFTENTGQKVNTDGLENYLKNSQSHKFAIVAVTIDNLMDVAIKLCQSGVENILLEKPGALSLKGINLLKKEANKAKSHIWIAYNRRFLSSIIKLKELIIADGGIKSIFFEFTELTEKINLKKKSNLETSKWILCNSTHVIDLVFHLIGFPDKKKCTFFNRGRIDWHQSSRFNGAGISEKEIPFSYHADWECPGRWGIEIMTLENRYILKPLEKLKVISRGGSLEPKEIAINNIFDTDYKPGLFKQCQAFLDYRLENLCSLNSQLKAFDFYYSIAGYRN